MPFGVVGRLGSRIRQVNGGDHPTGRAILGEGERGVFSSGVGPEIGVLDGVHIPQGEGSFWGFSGPS